MTTFRVQDVLVKLLRALDIRRPLGTCKHSPHRDQPERTLEAISRFYRGLAPRV